MDYLLEIADRLLPSVKSASEAGVTGCCCAQTARGWFRAARQCVIDERKKRDGARVPEHQPPEGLLDKEVMADVLARHPKSIPGLLRAIGQPDFCPPFIADVVRSAVGEAGHGSASPKNKLRAVVTRLLSPEYAELLDTRPQRVASVLVSPRAGRICTHRWSPRTSSQAGSAEKLKDNPHVPRHIRRRLQRWAEPKSHVPLMPCATFSNRMRKKGSWWLPCAASCSRIRGCCSGSRRRPAWRCHSRWHSRSSWTRSHLRERRVDARNETSARMRMGAARSIAAQRRPLTMRTPAAFHRALPRNGACSASRSRVGASAAPLFNLGVIQGLARFGLLKEVDYLSTVSGGGYISSWLAAWIKRGGGVSAVERKLQVEPLPAPNADEARPVQFLREYSNYLTPELGFFNADFWSMVATWWRNTLLNQLVLVLFLAAVMFVPWLFWLALGRLDDPSAGATAGSLQQVAPKSFALVWLLAILAAAISGMQLRCFRITKDDPADQKRMLGQMAVLWTIVLPVLIASLLLSGILLASSKAFVVRPQFKVAAFWNLFWLFTACHGIVMVVGRCWRGFVHDRVSSVPTSWWGVRAALVIGLAVVISCFVGAASLVIVADAVSGLIKDADQTLVSWHWTVLGLPVVLTLTSFVNFLQIGILGRSFPDAQREWWSRLGAWLNLGSLAWLSVVGLALYSPYVTEKAVEWGREAVAGKIALAGGSIVWIVSTVFGVLLGKRGGASSLSELLKQPLSRRVFVRTAPFVFVGGLFVLISTAMYWLVSGAQPPAEVMLDTFGTSRWGFVRLRWLMVLPAALLLASFLLSCRVDVNEFSMHHFYKNRLVRCFLGASRDSSAASPRRTPDPFTGFDPGDDVWLADLQVNPGRFDNDLCDQKPDEVLASYDGPLPIVNSALNLVKGDNLAWQERKAQSFFFTPLFSGCDNRANAADAGDARLACYALRPTPLYAYPPYGVSLGTAAAISGAAANPNSGYHTSPAIAFLMTMFNARLGWWLGNPRDEYNWLRSTPRRGLLYLLNELFGLTNDRTEFVNLSDGGHFENLGIYELARRKCRFIVACDAEQDEHLTFNGLATAVRNCRADLGVEINVRPARIHPPRDSRSSKLHCVIGDIAYPDGSRGMLVYMKSSLTGDEPADVAEYSAREPSFPHHSTLGDQFFDESQFESYRKLGYHIATTTLRPLQGTKLLADRFAQLEDFWYPPSSAIEEHLANHLSQYDDLLERVRVGPGLEFADEAFFGKSLNSNARNQLYLGLHMLDLMQRVFIDLDIENDPDHPHIRGWKTIFQKWADQPAVRDAWMATSGSFSSRFRTFIETLILPVKDPAASADERRSLGS